MFVAAAARLFGESWVEQGMTETRGVEPETRPPRGEWMSPIRFEKPRRAFQLRPRPKIRAGALLSAVGTLALVCLLVAGICAALSRKLLG